MEHVKQYVLKHYPNMFKKKTVIRDGRGKITKTTYTDIDPIVVDMDSFWMVKNHKDASPIILSKNI